MTGLMDAALLFLLLIIIFDPGVRIVTEDPIITSSIVFENQVCDRSFFVLFILSTTLFVDGYCVVKVCSPILIDVCVLSLFLITNGADGRQIMILNMTSSSSLTCCSLSHHSSVDCHHRVFVLLHNDNIDYGHRNRQ